MTEITTRDPEGMDHADLRAEWCEASERLRHPSLLSRAEENQLWDRRRDLWKEMRGRVDAEGPECPECGGQQWAQEFGGPKRCTSCDYHPTLEEEDLIQEINEHWKRVKSGSGEAEA